MIDNFLLVVYYLVFLTSMSFVGRFVQRSVIKQTSSHFVECFVTSLAFGVVIYSAVFVYLGMFGVLNRNVLVFFFITPTVLRIVSLKKISIKIPWSLVKLFVKDGSFFLLLTLPLIAFLFIYPTSWDALAYHLTLPKIFLREKSLVFYPWFPESAYVIGIQTLFGYAEALGEVRLSNFITFGFFALTLVYLLKGMGELLSRRTSLVAAALFAGIPFIYTEVAISPYVDYPLAFFFLVATSHLIKGIKLAKKEYFISALTFALFTTFVKYTGIIFFATVLSVTFYIALRSKKFNIDYLRLLYSKQVFFLLLTALPVIFWYVRNYLVTRNPFYPYLNDVFKGLFYNPEFYVSNTTVIKAVNPLVRQSFANLISGRVTSDSLEILSPIFGAFLLMLGLLVGFATFLKVNTWKRVLFIVCLVFILATWFQVGLGALRYYIPVIALLAITISAALLDDIPNIYRINQRLTRIFLCTLLLVQLLFLVNRAKLFFKYNFPIALASVFSSSEAANKLYLQDNYEAINYVNQDPQIAKQKVLIMFDNRTYYFNHPFIYGHPDVFFGSVVGYDLSLERLRHEKVKYVFESSTWGYPRGFDIESYNKFKEEYTTLYKDLGNIKIYIIANL